MLVVLVNPGACGTQALIQLTGEFLEKFKQVLL